MTERVYRIRGGPPRDGGDLAFLDQLNDEQRAAVLAPEGPVLVIAGAGTGKTRTLAYRVARLLGQGVPPERIVLLTFTNRAAREMLARTESLVGGVARRVVGGTFHHVGNVILRRHAEVLGYRDGYSIIDPQDARTLLAACVGELGLSGSRQRFPRSDLILRAFSYAVNTGRPFAESFTLRYPHLADHAAAAERAVTRFVERKVELGLMDFDDLLLGWRLLLDGDPDVAALVRRRFHHVLVDEYQDTNALQGGIVDAMASEHRSVMVVGDDAQAIYSFRGASFENVIGFPDRYPDATVARLVQNYRSTPEVLALANRSITHNRRQFPKELTPVRGSGPLPAVVPCKDAAQQAAFVAHRVLELREEGTELRDIAVLYRAHRHAAELEVELKRRKIPFVVRSGVRFFEQSHIKDVLAWLRVLHNPRDELAWQRVLGLQPGIGPGITGRLVAGLRASADPLAAAASGTPPADRLPRRARESWEHVARLVAQLSSPALRDTPAAVMDAVVAGGYADHLRQNHPNPAARLEDLRALAGYAATFEGLRPFLDEVSGLTEVAGEGFRSGPAQEGEGEDEWLVLSTVHQAKGLEWEAVFVLGLAEGLFPLTQALRSEREVEEERRLFYVAATRAKTELHLCYPVFGPDRGYREVIQNPSSFLQEVQGTPHVYETWRVSEDA